MSVARPPGWIHGAFEVARKDFLQHLRTKRLLVLAIILALALLVFSIIIPTILLKNDALASFFGDIIALENGSILFFLQPLLLPGGYIFLALLAILLTADAVCSEWNGRTIFLLLSKPVSRSAFTVGKLSGAVFTVALTVAVMLGLDYLVLQFIFPGNPTPEAMTAFLLATGHIILGLATISAMALLFSSLTHSSVMSILLAVSSWIILFPMLTFADDAVAIIRHGEDWQAEMGTEWAKYLDPHENMKAASSILIGDVPPEAEGLLSIIGIGDLDPATAAMALAVQLALFLGLTLLVVTRRDFE